MSPPPTVHVIGGGLAGCEAAWQAASHGVPVTIHEMRPVRSTEVHRTDRLGELVCSNSLRGDKLDNAVGLLKAEMRRLGSLILRVADLVRVPAGAALAVDRDRFAEHITAAVAGHPLVTVVREEIETVAGLGDAASPLLIASGPLTAPALSEEIARLVGRPHLSFYDAVSPIVLADSIDHQRVFRASRWDRSLTAGVVAQDAGRDVGQDVGRGFSPAVGAGLQARPTDGDYLNCPFTEAEYARFYEALRGADLVPLREVEDPRFFEGCLPIEVMAGRGRDTLRYGPMKPVGLVDPRTGRRPFAVVQLRQDDLAAEHYSMVGFQTRMKRGEQSRVFRLVPGLEHAEFVRYGLVHRNTYIDGPAALAETGQLRSDPRVFFAGQVSGVEGYVESAASGLLAGINAARFAAGRPAVSPPRTTAIGALAYYVSHASPADFQPSNITFGIMTPLEQVDRRLRRDRLARNEAISARALGDLDRWIGSL